MTVKELRKLLLQFNENTEVKFYDGYCYQDIDEVIDTSYYDESKEKREYICGIL